MTGKGRAARIDTNWWKTFVALRWLTPIGSPGCLSVFGTRAADHQMFADHCTSETAVEVNAQGRSVYEWFLKPQAENEWFDCLVGCAAGAAITGLKWSPAHSAPGSAAPPTKPANPAPANPTQPRERTYRRARNPI
jgi:phage terminase large subunit GpA-like protein